MSTSVKPATLARFDDVRRLVGPTWAIWCVKVRPGHRGQGIPRVLMRLDLR